MFWVAGLSRGLSCGFELRVWVAGLKLAWLHALFFGRLWCGLNGIGLSLRCDGRSLCSFLALAIITVTVLSTFFSISSLAISHPIPSHSVHPIPSHPIPSHTRSLLARLVCVRYTPTFSLFLHFRPASLSRLILMEALKRFNFLISFLFFSLFFFLLSLEPFLGGWSWGMGEGVNVMGFLRWRWWRWWCRWGMKGWLLLGCGFWDLGAEMGEMGTVGE